MKFVIITHVNHIQKGDEYFGYAPYIREMNIWCKYADEVIVVAPLLKSNPTQIDLAYRHSKIDFRKVPDFNFTSFKNNFSSIFKLPIISWKIFWAMYQADHIHLRCPGNIGLLGCFVQILFSRKSKTAKYAGNWDPKAKQPWSYRLQKWILNNTFLTRNMQVLVYGEWEGSSRNIKPFFTATYSEADKVPMKKLDLKEKINFVFVGTLASGKNPLYAIQLVEALLKKGYNVSLNLYGEGIERKVLEDYIVFNNLEKNIKLKGIQNQEVVTKAYQNSHFVLLPSKSEGWPKALAEGMFWGCVPIATSVSCVPFMLDYGERGMLLQVKVEQDLIVIRDVLNNESIYREMATNCIKWSRQFTMDKFESEIRNIIVN